MFKSIYIILDFWLFSARLFLTIKKYPRQSEMLDYFIIFANSLINWKITTDTLCKINFRN